MRGGWCGDGTLVRQLPHPLHHGPPTRMSRRDRTVLNGSMFFSSGFCATTAGTRSRQYTTCVYIGCSPHSVCRPNRRWRCGPWAVPVLKPPALPGDTYPLYSIAKADPRLHTMSQCDRRSSLRVSPVESRPIEDRVGSCTFSARLSALGSPPRAGQLRPVNVLSVRAWSRGLPTPHTNRTLSSTNRLRRNLCRAWRGLVWTAGPR